ncbi:hypothetical protein BaRGS_00016851 [Batillaria attramentaria]|uniref:Uncharacterized protein n=1 Tax=Batillaria attramentaria TaxID=370345 RepID=A0ABD0KYG0_9CAEN
MNNEVETASGPRQSAGSKRDSARNQALISCQIDQKIRVGASYINIGFCRVRGDKGNSISRTHASGSRGFSAELVGVDAESSLAQPCLACSVPFPHSRAEVT